MKNKTNTRTSTLFIIALYLLSAISMGFAVDSVKTTGVSTTGVSSVSTTMANDGSIQTTRDIGERIDDRSIREKAGTRITAELKKVEKVKAMALEREEKLNKINSVDMEKIKKLDNWQIRRLTGLSDENFEKLAVLGANELKGLSMLTKDEIKNLAHEDPKKIRTIILERVKEKQELKENDFKRRVVSKEKIVQFEQKYKIADEKYNVAKEKYFEKKNQLVKLNKEFKLCEANETEECVALRANIQEHAKEYLLNAADTAIGVLEKMQFKIKSLEDLDEETITNMTTNIENKIKEIEDLKLKIEAAQTKEELKLAAGELKDVIVSVKNRVKYNAGRVKAARVGLIVERSEHLELRLEAVLADMETQNISVSVIDSKVAEFNERIAAAREQYELAKSLFESAKDTDKSGQIIKESNEYIKDAQKEFERAHKILVEILKLIKDNGGNLNEGSKIDDDVEGVNVVDNTENEVKNDKVDDIDNTDSKDDEFDESNLIYDSESDYSENETSTNGRINK